MKADTVRGKKVKCYDNGGKTADRYTVVYLELVSGLRYYNAVGMSCAPFHPQGVGQHCTAQLGRHLGKRIAFDDLPDDCKILVENDLS